MYRGSGRTRGQGFPEGGWNDMLKPPTPAQQPNRTVQIEHSAPAKVD